MLNLYISRLNLCSVTCQNNTQVTQVLMVYVSAKKALKRVVSVY